jgi:hypothetical protein
MTMEGELVGLFWFCASKKQPVPEVHFDPTKKKLRVVPTNSAGLYSHKNILADPSSMYKFDNHVD